MQLHHYHGSGLYHAHGSGLYHVELTSTSKIRYRGVTINPPPLKDFRAPKFSKGSCYLQEFWQKSCQVFVIHKKKSPAAGFYYFQISEAQILALRGLFFLAKMPFLP